MDNATLKYVLDQLYKEYLIPLFLVNDQYEIVIPKTNWSSRSFKEQVLEETQPNEIRYFKKGAFFYSNFAFDLPEQGTGFLMKLGC
ncbi:AraC family transcriptional regulator, partial [Pediococcus acidilactici]|nr:AraC family transcriptional regulator [Pediococcus acidilactici]